MTVTTGFGARPLPDELLAGTHPLAESLTRVGSLLDNLEVRYGLPAQDDHEWLRCATMLAEPGQFDSWRKELGEWLSEHHGNAPERTTAGYVMSWYLTIPGYLGGLLFHSARRVPSLRPEAIAFRRSTERPHPVAIALLSGEFGCLPDDPASSLPEATVVADERSLAGLLRARFAAHAARFVAAFGPTSRLGRRMLWAAATDALDAGAWRAGQACGNEAAGVADSALLLPARIGPFTSASTLHASTDAAGRPHWTRRRQSCCFHYALATAPAACPTCPRLTQPSRVAPSQE